MSMKISWKSNYMIHAVYSYLCFIITETLSASKIKLANRQESYSGDLPSGAFIARCCCTFETILSYFYTLTAGPRAAPARLSHQFSLRITSHRGGAD